VASHETKLALEVSDLLLLRSAGPVWYIRARKLQVKFRIKRFQKNNPKAHFTYYLTGRTALAAASVVPRAELARSPAPSWPFAALIWQPHQLIVKLELLDLL